MPCDYHYYPPCSSPLSFVTSTPAPSPNLLLRRRRSKFNPPTLKKRKHCDNYITPTTTKSSSFLPIKTNLPFLDFGDDDDEQDDEANAAKNQTTCRNSLVFPPLPRITLKKRTNNRSSNSRSNNCFLSSSPQDFYLKDDDDEEEDVREQPYEEDQEADQEASQDRIEIEEPASRRRRTNSAPSSFTTITTNDVIENIPFKPISSTKKTLTNNNSNSNNNSISSMTRSVSLQFSLTLMNLSTASQQQQQCSSAPLLLPKRKSLLEISKSLSTMSLDLLNGSSGGSARSSPVTTTFDYLATAMTRFPDVAIGLSI